jgi:FtsP/CotA-like multicopper oxidase with cupredoxin domain
MVPQNIGNPRRKLAVSENKKVTNQANTEASTENSKDITRRHFIKVGLATAGVYALPTLVGCVATSEEEVVVTPEATVSQMAVASDTPAPGDVLKELQIIESQDHVLNAALAIGMATHTVAGKEMSVRSYGVVDPNDADKVTWLLPGPVLKMRVGDQIKLRLSNRLPKNVTGPNQCNDANGPTADVFPNCFHGDNDTNFHFHGFHVPQEVGNEPGTWGDNVLLILKPDAEHDDSELQGMVGSTTIVGEANYSFKIPEGQAPGTHWYHPHKHGSTALQVGNGMGSALIVLGDFDDQLEPKGMKEVVLIIQDINDALTYPISGSGGAPTTVNGQRQPIIKMQPGEVQRWRIVNATMKSTGLFTAAFETEGVTMIQIAQDGVQFAEPKEVDNFNMAPGNRIDLLVKAPDEPGFHDLQPVHTAPSLGQEERKQTQAATPLVTVHVDGEENHMELPAELPPMPPFLAKIEDDEIVQERTIVFSMEGRAPAPDSQETPMFFIDGVQFDPTVINHTMKVNTAEEWTLENKSSIPHPFHIHLNPFQVTKINGEAQDEPWVWQDTVAIPACQELVNPDDNYNERDGSNCETPGSVTIRMRFPEITGKFVFHCHILGHEDRGMMQIVEVVA